MLKPSDKKALMMLNIKRAQEGKELLKFEEKQSNQSSPIDVKQKNSLDNSSDTGTGFRWSKPKLVEELERKDINGHVLRSLAVAAVKFNISKGTDLLKAFRVSVLDYSSFRKFLKKCVSFECPDNEFSILCSFYDINNTGHSVDGNEFAKCFVIIRTLYMGEENARIRKREADYEEQVRLDEENRRKELEGKSHIIPNFDFSEAEEAAAMAKLTRAAVKYDKNHPSSMGLHAFEVKALKAGEFREVLRRTFNLPLDAKELGVMVKTFGDMETNTIPCVSFLQRFVKIGLDERNKSKMSQLAACKESEEQSKKYQADLLNANEMKLEVTIEDIKFLPERDQVRLCIW